MSAEIAESGSEHLERVESMYMLVFAAAERGAGTARGTRVLDKVNSVFW